MNTTRKKMMAWIAVVVMCMSAFHMTALAAGKPDGSVENAELIFHQISYDDTTRQVRMSVIVKNMYVAAGRFSLHYDQNKLSLMQANDQWDLEVMTTPPTRLSEIPNIISAEPGITVILPSFSEVDKMFRLDDGVLMLGFRGLMDATAEEKKIMTMIFQIKEPFTADDLNESSFGYDNIVRLTENYTSWRYAAAISAKKTTNPEYMIDYVPDYDPTDTHAARYKLTTTFDYTGSTTHAPVLTGTVQFGEKSPDSSTGTWSDTGPTVIFTNTDTNIRTKAEVTVDSTPVEGAPAGTISAQYRATLIPGNYTMEVTKDGHLSYKVTGISATTDDVAIAKTIDLVPGDLNADGKISLLDAVTFSRDTSKQKTVDDLSFVQNNFGEKSEEVTWDSYKEGATITTP